MSSLIRCFNLINIMKNTFLKTLKVWLTVLIPVIVIFCFAGPLPLKRVIPLVLLFSLLFSTPAALVYFILMSFSDTLNVFELKLKTYATITGAVSFYVSMICMWFYATDLSRITLPHYIIQKHASPIIFILFWTMAASYYWNRKTE